MEACIPSFLCRQTFDMPISQLTFHAPQDSCHHRLYKAYHPFLRSRYLPSPLCHSAITHDQQHYMRLLANGSSGSPLEAINPIQEVRALYVVILFPLSSSQIVRLQSAHLPHYNAAVASSLRDGPIRGLAYAFSALSNSSNDILLIHVCSFPPSQFIPRS